MDALVEHAFLCPCCWQSITVLIDASIQDQQYVEDCEVCCRPLVLSVHCEDGLVAELDAQPE